MGLAEGRISSLRFNFPYLEEGRRSPDRLPVLLEAWREALEEGRRRAGRAPVVAAGKSLGGRVASMLAAEQGQAFGAAALVFFGYPLHPPGRPHQVRDAHLSLVQVPMLFIQGTEDRLARFDLVRSLVARVGMARLHPVPGADHSFRVKGRRREDLEVGRELGSIAATFIAGLAS